MNIITFIINLYFMEWYNNVFTCIYPFIRYLPTIHPI